MLIRLIFLPPYESDSGQLPENLLSILFFLFDKRKDEKGKTIKTVENEYIHRAYLSI